LRVVVVGAGFAGTAVTVALLRRFGDRPVSIALVERTGSFGRGIAYSTPDPQHLLNVPASGMSAVPGQPGHLLEWARRNGIAASREDYLPRGVYGDYVEDLLASADRGRVRRVPEEAVAVDDAGVTTRGGRRLDADAVVLAAGPSTPFDPGPLAAVHDHPSYVANPWDHDAVMALAGGTRVVVVGTGLTMIDVALSLTAAAGPEIVATSRHGELPRDHRRGAPAPGEPAVRPGEHATAAGLVAHVESLARRGGDWRAVIDSLRPVTQALWRELPPAEQAIFYEQHSRRWEVHRSRIAPEVAARVRELRAAGRLLVTAGGLGGVEPAGEQIAVRLGGERLLVDGLVNATGPAWDCRDGDSELIKGMLARGVAAPGPLGLGLRATAGGALIDDRGRVSDRLFTLGALLRGELWETIAVPEIREQAAAIADRLAGGTS
jgi:uncharacterized NAD(P)/FAD-binding protein YdhS